MGHAGAIAMRTKLSQQTQARGLNKRCNALRRLNHSAVCIKLAANTTPVAISAAEPAPLRGPNTGMMKTQPGKKKPTSHAALGNTTSNTAAIPAAAAKTTMAAAITRPSKDELLAKGFRFGIPAKKRLDLRERERNSAAARLAPPSTLGLKTGMRLLTAAASKAQGGLSVGSPAGMTQLSGARQRNTAYFSSVPSSGQSRI